MKEKRKEKPINHKNKENNSLENIILKPKKYELSFLNKIKKATISNIKISKSNFYKLTSYLFHITSCLISEEIRVPVFFTTLNLLIKFENSIYFSGENKEFLLNYQLIGLSIISISFKYFCKNLDKILFKDLIKVSNQIVNETQLKECEMFILQILNFQINEKIDDFFIFCKKFEIKVLNKFNPHVGKLNLEYLSFNLIFYSICKEKTLKEKILINFLLNNIRKNIIIDSQYNYNNISYIKIKEKFLNEFTEFISADDECIHVLKRLINDKNKLY